MSDKKRSEKGYRPATGKKEQNRQKPGTGKRDRGNVTGGYQPTTSQGDNPGNKPPPKKP